MNKDYVPFPDIITGIWLDEKQGEGHDSSRTF